MTPWLMCAEASCPHASAVTSSHSSREAHPSALARRDAAARTMVVQANAPENGSETVVYEAAIDRARQRPPTVAAALAARQLRPQEAMRRKPQRQQVDVLRAEPSSQRERPQDQEHRRRDERGPREG